MKLAGIRRTGAISCLQVWMCLPTKVGDVSDCSIHRHHDVTMSRCVRAGDLGQQEPVSMAMQNVKNRVNPHDITSNEHLQHNTSRNSKRV